VYVYARECVFECASVRARVRACVCGCAGGGRERKRAPERSGTGFSPRTGVRNGTRHPQHLTVRVGCGGPVLGPQFGVHFRGLFFRLVCWVVSVHGTPLVGLFQFALSADLLDLAWVWSLPDFSDQKLGVISGPCRGRDRPGFVVTPPASSLQSVSRVWVLHSRFSSLYSSGQSTRTQTRKPILGTPEP